MTAAGVQMEGARPARQAEVVLGEDWIGADAAAETEARAKREKRGVIAMNRSPLARKIITFNLLAILVLVSGVLFLNPFRDSLVYQREKAIVSEAELIAGFIEAQFPGDIPVDLRNVKSRFMTMMSEVTLPSAASLFVYDANGILLASIDQPGKPEAFEALRQNERSTMITDALDSIWNGMSFLFGRNAERPEVQTDNATLVRGLISATLTSGNQVRTTNDIHGNTIFTVATPIEQGGTAIGAVALASAAGEIDGLVRSEREQILQMFVIAILVSVGLSLVLASTIANPLSDLAAAAEIGREKNARKFSPSRVRIPDLTARPDEIGRLSGALRGMVTALYDRIDANEQFAADVAHEIKNPLASLSSHVIAHRETRRPPGETSGRDRT